MWLNPRDIATTKALSKSLQRQSNKELLKKY